jgi:hypothetical protein
MPTDPDATANAILDVTGAYSQAIVDGTVSLHGDPSGGLADLANWGADILAANPGTSLQQAANARATVDLVRGAAVAALAELYAGMDWTSADAASAARDQLVDLLDARQLATAAAGQDAFAAWQALASVALQDLTLRAQQLPQPIGYPRPKPPAALALAYRLYQNTTRARQPGRAERCTASAVHAHQWQGAGGGVNHIPDTAAICSLRLQKLPAECRCR